jgi:hypothetical protein
MFSKRYRIKYLGSRKTPNVMALIYEFGCAEVHHAHHWN